MNWLTNLRPKIRALVTRQADVPDNLWTKCPSCGAMLFHRDCDANLRVCTHCGHHLRLSARRRAELLMDEGFVYLDTPRVALDPLKFRDRKRYLDRLKEAQSQLQPGQTDGLLIAAGSCGGRPTVMALFDFEFMGGSMGPAVGEGFLAAAKAAIERRAALVAIPASGGARMQEGVLSLMQMPRTTIGVQMMREAGLPYVVILTDPTTGGVTASFAMLGDVSIAEPGAMIGFAGQRVIEETLKERLPDGFQRAEYLLEHGMIDMVTPRHALKETLAKVIGVFLDAPAAKRALAVGE